MKSLTLRRMQSVLPEVGMLIPALVLLALFVFVPFLLSFQFSFTNERLMPQPLPTRWLGLRNYERVLTDPEFWTAVRNTVYFAAVVIPVQLSLSLASALLLNSKIKGLVIFRSIAILPLLMPMTVIATLWAALYRTPDGLLNSVYQTLFNTLSYIEWLGDPGVAMISIIILSIWASFPFQMLLYLAGLQEVPQDRYEAAAIDGFGQWDVFRHVTFPGLRNTNVFVVITTTIGALSLFTQVKILTNGGPNGATLTIIQYMFSNGYSAQKIGFASAVGIIFFVTVASLSIAQRLLVKNED
jgi:multiple sugar transport system permease protein